MSPPLISSPSSSEIPSASQHLRPICITGPSFPPPLSNVSVSEVCSTSSTEIVGERVTAPEGLIDRRALALFHEAVNGVWGEAGQLYHSHDHRLSILKVARWLLSNQSSTSDSDVLPLELGPRGSHLNPIVIDEDSDASDDDGDVFFVRTVK